MSFDNRIFNINGIKKKHLRTALKLAFQIESDHNKDGAMAEGYVIDPKKGIIFLWNTDTTKNAIGFSEPKNFEACYDFAKQWLATPDALNTELLDGEDDYDHDGSNDLGWRVYLEDWGHVGSNRYAICAVKPCYVWYGK